MNRQEIQEHIDELIVAACGGRVLRGASIRDAAHTMQAMLKENERLQARLAAHVEHEGDECPLCVVEARNELLEKVVEAASACIAAWDDAKWPSPIPLRKAIAALKT